MCQPAAGRVPAPWPGHFPLAAIHGLLHSVNQLPKRLESRDSIRCQRNSLWRKLTLPIGASLKVDNPRQRIDDLRFDFGNIIDQGAIGRLGWPGKQHTT